MADKADKNVCPTDNLTFGITRRKKNAGEKLYAVFAGLMTRYYGVIVFVNERVQVCGVS